MLTLRKGQVVRVADCSHWPFTVCAVKPNRGTATARERGYTIRINLRTGQAFGAHVGGEVQPLDIMADGTPIPKGGDL